MNTVNSVKNIKHVERYFQRGFFGNSFDNSDQKAASNFFERNYLVHVAVQIKNGWIKIEISAIATMDEALLRLQVRCAIDKV